MASLLQHMRPWMQRAVDEAEARIEKMIDDKSKSVHMWLDKFELRVLQRPQTQPTIYVTSFQSELDQLRAEVVALATQADIVPEVAPEIEANGVVLSALFGDEIFPHEPSRVARN
ncbi:hypothetical protein MTR67_038931 [Solanum verrucosum]|uniref:Integrase core domain containing protein n=1 Tax=Solanum verrucosum TaxID=315347 RepID=A0AAF0UH58_SOLVR|nr:hypothetical protein MTR67_038931 [Solanum verrucosum]